MDGRTKQGVVACTRLKIRNKSTINHEMHIQKHVLKKKTPIYTFFQSARAAFIGKKKLDTQPVACGYKKKTLAIISSMSTNRQTNTSTRFSVAFKRHQNRSNQCCVVGQEEMNKFKVYSSVRKQTRTHRHTHTRTHTHTHTRKYTRKHTHSQQGRCFSSKLIKLTQGTIGGAADCWFNLTNPVLSSYLCFEVILVYAEHPRPLHPWYVEETR